MNTGPLKHEAATSIAGCNTEFLSRHASKVLIQDAMTRRFLTAADLWTPQADQAMTFRSGSAAMEHVTRKKLTKVQLVLTRAITFSEVIPTGELLRA
ncbi:MAG: hypothetical protein QM813_05575 [Verrucomicrobiota bacterium]